MLPDRTVNDAWVAPPGRFLWGELAEIDEDHGLTVVDLEEWRVAKRPDAHGSEPVPGSSPPRVLAHRLDDRSSSLHDARGERLTWRPPDDRVVGALVSRPHGSGMVALLVARDDEDGPLELMEILDDGDTNAEPLILEGSHGEAPAVLAVSREARLVFVLTPIDGRDRLSAYRSGIDGLELVWAVEVSDPTVLVQDESARFVLALSATPDGVDLAILGRTAPSFEAAPRSRLVASSLWRTSREVFGDTCAEELALLEQRSRQRGATEIARWSERLRKERRGDPIALAALVDVLSRTGQEALADRILDLAIERHGGHARLLLSRAWLAAAQADWRLADDVLGRIDLATLSGEDAERVHHLWAAARLRVGDAAGALEHFRAGGEPGPYAHGPRADLTLARALVEAPDSSPQPEDSAERRLVRACRSADTHLAAGDPEAARRALEAPVVHAVLERQSAARLADAHLALDAIAPLDILRKAIALARITSASWERAENIDGLGWPPERIADVVQRARAWLDLFGEEEPRPAQPIRGWASLIESRTSSQTGPHALQGGEPLAAHPSVDPHAPEFHALPPLAHETMRALVPDLDAAVGETVRYVRTFPGWDETRTLGDDLGDLAPTRRFLTQYQHRREARDDLPPMERLRLHLDYCVNFELHRRKIFFVDASLCWMLLQTSLEIDGRALRLPFSCFGLVFTDPSVLALAEALLERESVASRLQVLTVYVIRDPAREGRSSMRLSMLFDDRSGAWPHLRAHVLRFEDHHDLDQILGGDATSPKRRLLHLIVNAILYATSADVPWPLSRSPARRLRAQGRDRGKAKRERVAKRVEELREHSSGEDVFYLPGRIPISQLRAIEETERGARGGELMARFMVRGHWRRASSVWRVQGLRWIEPYWKGPELAAIIEREYKLKV